VAGRSSAADWPLGSGGFCVESRPDLQLDRSAELRVAIELAADQFDALVAEALDSIPAELAEVIENCVILVEEWPPPDDPDLLGLYEGVPLTERGQYYSGTLPDRILIFRAPILQMCDSVDEVVDEVHLTVVHEIAHHFGIGDARLHELGYG
jgi:predicted Zn-dependent protease with MMP-like domain